MSDAQDDGVRLGVLGPWRRWRDWEPHERVAMVIAWSVAAITTGLLLFLLGPVLGDDEGVGGAVFFTVAMVLVAVYLPELTRLWHKMDGDS